MSVYGFIISYSHSDRKKKDKLTLIQYLSVQPYFCPAGVDSDILRQ